MSSLLAAGAAHGRTRLFLASEAEVQENAEGPTKIIQHPHYMYSAATQRALSRYLEPYGIFFGSLIWPLYSMQVQQLLWTRYKDLSDLQYSCWRVEEGQATCSRCEAGMRIAMTALAAGHNPERMGIDLGRLMSYSPNWAPIGNSHPRYHKCRSGNVREILSLARLIAPALSSWQLFICDLILKSSFQWVRGRCLPHIAGFGTASARYRKLPILEYERHFWIGSIRTFATV